jgi:hypothetical protein
MSHDESLPANSESAKSAAPKIRERFVLAGYLIVGAGVVATLLWVIALGWLLTTTVAALW